MCCDWPMSESSQVQEQIAAIDSWDLGETGRACRSVSAVKRLLLANPMRPQSCHPVPIRPREEGTDTRGAHRWTWIRLVELSQAALAGQQPPGFTPDPCEYFAGTDPRFRNPLGFPTKGGGKVPSASLVLRKGKFGFYVLFFCVCHKFPWLGGLGLSPSWTRTGS